MNIPAAPSSRTKQPLSSALTRLDRVVSELRRSAAVLVRNSEDAVLVLSAENITAGLLSNYVALSDDAPRIVITGQRAYRLGFAVERNSSVYSVSGTTALSTDLIHGIVNPLSTQANDRNISQQLQALTITPGSEIDKAAIAMAKHGGLLPALIVLNYKDDSNAKDVLEITVDDIYAGLEQATSDLRVVAQARVPLEDAENTRIIAFRPRDGGAEHLAIVVGEPDINEPVLIRIHSECYTGDLVGSLRCDCGHQLRGAIALMAGAGSGIVLYMSQEGRGIGLINKLRAYQLQDSGLDTVDANLELGFEEDEREYKSAAEMLKLLKVKQVRLLTNNPKKVQALSRMGVEVVERVAHVFPANRHNRGYLYTKGARSGHLLDIAQYVTEPQDKD